MAHDMPDKKEGVSSMLEIKNLKKSYDGATILHDINLTGTVRMRQDDAFKPDPGTDRRG